MIKVCTCSPLHWTDKRSYFGDMDGVQWICFLNEKMLKKVFHTRFIQLQLLCSKDFFHFCLKCLSLCCITKKRVVVILVGLFYKKMKINVKMVNSNLLYNHAAWSPLATRNPKLPIGVQMWSIIVARGSDIMSFLWKNEQFWLKTWKT